MNGQGNRLRAFFTRFFSPSVEALTQAAQKHGARVLRITVSARDVHVLVENIDAAALQPVLLPLCRGRRLRITSSGHRAAAPHALPHPVFLPKIKRIVAVASGKGGVGKSTVCAGLAHAAVRAGLRVGVLDADVYGPSMHCLLHVDAAPIVRDGRLQPNLNPQGIALLSLGNAAAQALIWRGPMASGAVEKLFAANWGELDLLLVDLPPGTGDIPLTVGRKMPLHAVLLVTTPSPVAVQAVQRGLGLWQKLRTPIAGVVCTMSEYVCACGAEHAPFGRADAVTIAPDAPLIAQLPLGCSPAEADAVYDRLVQLLTTEPMATAQPTAV